MARRRLAPLDPATAPLGRPAPLRPGPSAPIARVAAEAASAAALEDLAASVARARATGRMVLDLPLEQIAPDHLTRDRLPAEDEAMAELRESIRAHGQRTPIEVTPLAGDLPYGLISGWRRLQALQALRAETGEARFATVQALVRRPETAADAYVTMVEENEIRVGLSHYERARVAAIATRRGIFESEKKALLALFGTASRPKRSRIRAFLEIYHALDGVLRFPAHLPERLGLALVELIRNGARDGVAETIARADPRTPEAELAALQTLLRRPAADRQAPEPLRPGVTLEQSLRGRTLTLRLKGKGVTPALAAEARDLLRRLGGHG
jgi:hypothetical protein